MDFCFWLKFNNSTKTFKPRLIPSEHDGGGRGGGGGGDGCTLRMASSWQRVVVDGGWAVGGSGCW